MSIEITNLTKKYARKTILDNLNLTLQDAESIVIMGKSGTGKTTLLLCILGFIPIDLGTITCDGIGITTKPIQERQIAYLPQDYALFPHLDVEKNITFGLTVRGTDTANAHLEATRLMQLVELPPDLMQRNVRTLSGGEQQRVALARALAIKPKLFLLDEPLSAIDPETKKQVGTQLRKLIKKLRIPAIIVTHDPRDAALLGDTIYRLENGTLRKQRKK